MNRRHLSNTSSSASQFGSDCFSDLDDSEEDDPVQHHHTAQDGEVYPFGVAHLHLQLAPQDLDTADGDVRLAQLITWECQVHELVLVEPLHRVLVERHVVARVLPYRLRELAGKAEEAPVEHHHPLHSGSDDDPHQEIRNNCGDNHHQALNQQATHAKDDDEVGEVIHAFC